MQISFINQRLTREKCKFPIISDFPILSLRAELHYIERAELLKRRKEIYETMFPESKAGVKRAYGMHKSLGHDVADIMSPTFTEETAKKTGESQRHIRRLIQIAESLPEDVKEKVKEIDLPMNGTYIIYFILHYKSGIIKL